MTPNFDTQSALDYAAGLITWTELLQDFGACRAERIRDHGDRITAAYKRKHAWEMRQTLASQVELEVAF